MKNKPLHILTSFCGKKICAGSFEKCIISVYFLQGCFKLYEIRPKQAKFVKLYRGVMV